MRRSAIYLFAALCGLYFLFFSGFEISNDERILWDGVHSFATQGNLWLNYTNSLRSPITLPGNQPVPILDSEPGQVIAALPLYLVASAVPFFGLVQTTWLLNIIITALTAVVLLYYARLLGYSARIALAAALLFGTATIAFPYTKTFFREPLFSFLAFSSAYALEHWRQHGQLRWAAVGLISLAACFATKDATVFFVPVLLVILAPAAVRRLDRRSFLVLIGAALVATAAILILSRFVANGRFDISARLMRAINEAEQTPYALAGYLISPGRGIFSFSPVLLLGLAGVVLSIRARRWRAVLVPAVALISFTIGYAVLQNRDWYGGTGWGPRYMLPITPFLVLAALPVLDRLPHASRIIQALAGAMITVSVALQLLAVAVPVNDYYRYLAAEGDRTSRSIVGWIDGTWNLAYIPQTVLPRIIGKAPLDLAWDANHAPLMAVVCLLLFCLALWLAIRVTRGGPPRTASPKWSHLRIAGAALAPVFLFSLGLWTARFDPRYGGSDPSARAALEGVYRALGSDTAVLLGSNAYLHHFMNYYRARTPIFLLPPSPGEVDIPGTPPKVVSANLDKGVAPEATMLLARLSLTATRWLYVTEFVPGDTSRTRIMEHYLARHYFPISTPFASSTARVVAFSSRDAPPDFVPPWPAALIEARFADTFRVVGYDMPAAIKRGDVLPLSLLWYMEGFAPGVEPFNYSINVSLIRPDGVVVAQRTGEPLGTFGQFAAWQPGDYYRDNHGLSVPPDAPPGVYEVWIVIYDWRDNRRLPVATDRGLPLRGPSTNGNLTDHLILGRVIVE